MTEVIAPDDMSRVLQGGAFEARTGRARRVGVSGGSLTLKCGAVYSHSVVIDRT